MYILLSSYRKTKRMKRLYLFLFLFISFSCTFVYKQKHNKITIDLTNSTAKILYSQLTDSVYYLTLNTLDSCLISGIEKIYQDGDTLILKDTGRGGVFVFSQQGKFIKQINYIGNGPEEFVEANSMAVDKENNLIYVYDISSRKINKYTYQGKFVESTEMNDFIRDFAIMSEDTKLMILPFYAKKSKYGVWLADAHNKFIKHLISDVPQNHNFEYASTSYNHPHSDEIYYYDRNNDNFFLITKDSAQLIYEINLKQRVPEELRLSDSPQPSSLEGYAMMNDFYVSPQHLILIYYVFGKKEQPYQWVFIDRKNPQKPVIGNGLKNNMDDKICLDGHLFYINDSTLCREIETPENDCNIILQFLRL